MHKIGQVYTMVQLPRVPAWGWDITAGGAGVTRPAGPPASRPDASRRADWGCCVLRDCNIVWVRETRCDCRVGDDQHVRMICVLACVLFG